jgi:hypothetical protein
MRLSAGAPHPGTGAERISRCSRPTPSAVEACLFDSHGRREIERITLPERTEDVWHG